MRDNTGEVADDDGDTGDGGEAEVVEGVEIGDGLCEWRITIYDRILRLRRRRDVSVHVSPSLLSFFSSIKLSLNLMQLFSASPLQIH